jgi:hypothetical protein
VRKRLATDAALWISGWLLREPINGHIADAVLQHFPYEGFKTAAEHGDRPQFLVSLLLPDELPKAPVGIVIDTGIANPKKGWEERKAAWATAGYVVMSVWDAIARGQREGLIVSPLPAR